jgi:hypothetical protein
MHIDRQTDKLQDGAMLICAAISSKSASASIQPFGLLVNGKLKWMWFGRNGGIMLSDINHRVFFSITNIK